MTCMTKNASQKKRQFIQRNKKKKERERKQRTPIIIKQDYQQWTEMDKENQWWNKDKKKEKEKVKQNKMGIKEIEQKIEQKKL